MKANIEFIRGDRINCTIGKYSRAFSLNSNSIEILRDLIETKGISDISYSGTNMSSAELKTRIDWLTDNI